MNPTDEMFILAMIAIIIVGLVCLGLLVVLNKYISGREQANTAPQVTMPLATNQSKRIANCTVAMTVGLTALVFAAKLVPIQQNTAIATILLVGGLGTIIGAWIAFRRI